MTPEERARCRKEIQIRIDMALFTIKELPEYDEDNWNHRILQRVVEYLEADRIMHAILLLNHIAYGVMVTGQPTDQTLRYIGHITSTAFLLKGVYVDLIIIDDEPGGPTDQVAAVVNSLAAEREVVLKKERRITEH